MNKNLDCLLALQNLQFNPRAKTPASQAEIEKLCVQVPAPILAHYERLVLRGKKGVAFARHGVCSECHLRIPGGKLIDLSSAPGEVHLCDNCGRYLYLPENEPATPDAANSRAATPAKRRSRKAVAQVV